MSEEMRHNAIQIADSSFKSPVSHAGKVYERIADLIRVEFGRFYDGRERGDGGAMKSGKSAWNCVVGDSFGSCVTHRMKTYM